MIHVCPNCLVEWECEPIYGSPCASPSRVLAWDPKCKAVDPEGFADYMDIIRGEISSGYWRRSR